MDTQRLSRMDLNLLVALQVLLEEQNVSKAAARLFITQSAMSKTLSRLRELFDDPLFTRSAHSMVPTPKAIELHSSLEEILLKIDALVGAGEIDPGQFRGQFHISALDHFILPMIPSLVEIFQTEAPELRIKMSMDVEEQFKSMAEGRIDLAIGPRRLEYQDDFIVEHLCETQPVFLLRTDHPLKKLENPSWRDLMQYPEVALKVPSAAYLRSSWMHRRFSQYRKFSTIVLETPDYLAAIQTIAKTDCLMPTPRMSLPFIKATGAISTIPLPGREGKYTIEVMLVYHQRTAHSPLHRWVRARIKEIYARLFD
ncbi:MAG: LysR family transcriptional regulator [Cellvibrionales bacterium]|nr:LysR family transcriptional regulator [Cellvibrionales bacterium]